MRGSSVPVLHLRPQFLQRLLEPSAIEHVGMLVRHRVWVVHARDLLHARKQLLEALLAIIHDDHTFARVIARSPEEIALVTADRPRQSIFRPEEIDRAGLAIVLDKDRRLRSNIDSAWSERRFSRCSRDPRASPSCELRNTLGRILPLNVRAQKVFAFPYEDHRLHDGGERSEGDSGDLFRL